MQWRCVQTARSSPATAGSPTSGWLHLSCERENSLIVSGAVLFTHSGMHLPCMHGLLPVLASSWLFGTWIAP